MLLPVVAERSAHVLFNGHSVTRQRIEEAREFDEIFEIEIF